MNKRQKKKLKNRAGFFHYKDYKLRVKWLYHAIDVVMKSSVPYAFKSFMFEHFKGLLLRQAPKKICDQNLRYKPFLTNCVGTSVGRYADIAKPDVIPSMSMRMVGDKIHSFSIDEDSFKNGFKPDELAPPLPKGPLDGHKSMTSAKLSAIRENPEMVSAKLTIEHGDVDRMRRQIKYPDTNWPPEGTTVETTISDDGDTRVDVIKREGEPDLRLVYQGLNEDEPDPVVISESFAKELKVQCHSADEHILGGSAIEYPSSATIDLRKAAGRYGNMSIKGTKEDVSGPIHLGPIELGPTDGERIEEHLDDLIDRRKRFAGNSCEASALD
ncbi:MAG: hypothetical protein J5614_09850 [Paludibacteraceae bacterium]|nr:hypothetical protein [Paludibacteraceae bacterium]